MLHQVASANPTRSISLTTTALEHWLLPLVHDAINEIESMTLMDRNRVLGPSQIEKLDS